jgi:EmrB/QacA subfamily drug resistance transporter
MLGVTMTGIDTSAVVLGLPVMKRDLGSNLISMIWVIMAYLLVITILGTQVGRLGDMFGRVRMYNLGFASFTFGSLLCAFSASGPQLIGFRVVQGLGGALIYSNSGAIIADTFPQNERGRAFGITGTGYSLGAILGILVGGAFVTFLSWRYIFLINLPIGIIATAVGFFMLRERSPKIKSKLDIGGMVILGSSLFFLLFGMTNVTGSGITPEYAAEVAVGLVLLPAFITFERWYSSPLLDLSLLKQRVLTASIFAAFLQSLASFAVLFLLIMYLQGPRDMTPWNAALLLTPGYVLGGAIAPFSGRMSDRMGARVIASIGLALQVCGFLVYSTLGLTTSTYVVIVGAVLNGAGSSSFFPANNSAVMASAPPSGVRRSLWSASNVSQHRHGLQLRSRPVNRIPVDPPSDGLRDLLGPRHDSGPALFGLRGRNACRLGRLNISAPGRPDPVNPAREGGADGQASSDGVKKEGPRKSLPHGWEEPATHSHRIERRRQDQAHSNLATQY